MKIAMACVANHTISCDSEDYSRVNMRVGQIRQQFNEACGGNMTLPPEHCTPPPAIPFGNGNGSSGGGKVFSNSFSLEQIELMAGDSLFDDTFICQ